MEGKRLRYLGAFAEVLSIRPWEIEDLPLVEFHALCGYIDQRQAKLEEAMGG